MWNTISDCRRQFDAGAGGARPCAEESPATSLDDSGIAATIKAGLLDNKNTHAGRINVESYKGVVQLSGFVATQAEKEAAGKVAKRVSGVREVNNSIALQPSDFARAPSSTTACSPARSRPR